MIEDLFRTYDGKLRAVIGRMGIDDPMLQEDLAQDTWLQLVGRRNNGKMPDYPPAWLFKVARRRVSERLEREARVREWERHATEGRMATGRGSFRIDEAIATAGSRLSNREQQILMAAQKCKTPVQLAKSLGYPTPKVAQSAVSRVRQRLQRILRDEVDVSFMFRPHPDRDMPASSPQDEATVAVLDWDPIPPAPPRSGESQHLMLERLRLVDRLGSQAKGRAETAPLLGSFAVFFDRLLGKGEETSEDEWAQALGLDPQDIVQLRSGQRTVLELDPQTVVMLSDLLCLDVRDVALMGVGDVGLRPVEERGGLSMKENLLPKEEADLRVEAILAEAEALAAL